PSGDGQARHCSVPWELFGVGRTTVVLTERMLAAATRVILAATDRCANNHRRDGSSSCRSPCSEDRVERFRDPHREDDQTARAAAATRYMSCKTKYWHLGESVASSVRSLGLLQ